MILSKHKYRKVDDYKKKILFFKFKGGTYYMDALMNYNKDMHGKEVIDSYGNVLGKVNNISWDKSTNEIKFFEIGSGGIMEMLGRGETKILPFDIIETIGEKILIKTIGTETVNKDIYNVKTISKNKEDTLVKEGTIVTSDSKVKNGSLVTHTSRIKDISKLNISKVKDVSKVKGLSMNKKPKKVVDEKSNEPDIEDIEDTIEDFRIRNSF
jgi:sporulation protein YlmC with PRC-barrel domain